MTYIPAIVMTPTVRLLGYMDDYYIVNTGQRGTIYVFKRLDKFCLEILAPISTKSLHLVIEKGTSILFKWDDLSCVFQNEAVEIHRYEVLWLLRILSTLLKLLACAMSTFLL